jgi:hypothetical protein
MAGSAVVTTTIRLQGEDRASAEINKAKGAIDHTAKSLENAASKSDIMQGSLSKAFSGDILGAAKDLNGIMGSGSGLAGTMALAAVGAVAVGVAIAGAAIKAAEWSSQIEKLRAATNHALGPDGMERMHALAEAAGGSAEDYGKLAGRLKLMGIDAKITAEQMAELGDRADNVGLDGAAAIAAFGDAIETGKTKSLKAFGVYVDSEEAVKKYAKAHNISTEAMSEADKQTALLAAITENLDKKLANVSSTASRQDDAMDRLGNTWGKLKMELSGAATGPLADVMEAIAETVDVTMRWGKVLVALADLALRPIITLIKVQIDAFVGLAAAANALIQRDFAGAAEIAKAVGGDIKRHLVDDNMAAVERLGKAFDDALNPKKRAVVSDSLEIKGDKRELGYEADGPSPDVIEKMRQDRYAKAQKAKDAAHSKAIAAGKKHADDIKKQADLEEKTKEEWADRAIKNEAADLDTLTKMREDADKRVRDLNLKAVTDPNERLKIRQLELEAQRVKDLAKVRDTTFASKKAQDQANMAVERAFAAEKKQLAKEAADEADKSSKAQIDAAFSVAESVKGALGQMGMSKQVMAGIDAAIETAKAIASGAEAMMTGDPRAIAAAVQHGLAAAAFAAAAAGGGSGSGGSGGGGYAPAAAAPNGSASSGGGGQTTHVHFSKGFVFGSPQEVGKGISDTLKTLSGTGYATARGA